MLFCVGCNKCAISNREELYMLEIVNNKVYKLAYCITFRHDWLLEKNMRIHFNLRATTLHFSLHE